MRRRTVLASVGSLTALGAGCVALGYRRSPARPASRFDGEPCPPFGSASGTTVCFHAMEGPPAYLEPSAERFVVEAGDDAVETVEFALRDAGPRPVRFDPQLWTVMRREGTEWFRAAPEGHPPMPEYRPLDGTFTWSLAPRAHPFPRDGETKFVTADLDAGVHAFVVSGRVGDDRDLTCVALFDVAVR